MFRTRLRRIALIVAALLACLAAGAVWLLPRGRPVGIQGSVTLDGKPVAGATIVIDPLRPWSTEDSFTADDAGRFSIADAPWEWCRVAAVSDERYAVVLLGPDRRGSLELELRPPATLEAEITGEGGAPLVSPRVRLIEPIDERGAAERHLYAASASALEEPDDQPVLGVAVEQRSPTTFHAAGLYPGRYFLWVRATDFAETFFSVEIAAGIAARPRVTLARLVRATGTLTDSRGGRLAHATLELTPLSVPPGDPAEALMAALRDEAFELLGPLPKVRSTTTDERGAFDVELGPGSYSVVAHVGDLQFVAPELTAPASGSTLVARPSPR